MSRGADLWSRRKARVAAEEAAEAAKTRPRDDPATQTEVAALDERPDEDVLAELGLPDPDTMKTGDDFTAFMARAVPERLRRRALRKLWTSNPVLACVDGLNDYDDDYTTAAVCGADMKTAYEVGRGIVRKIVEADPANCSEEPALTQPIAASRPEELACAAAEEPHGEDVSHSDPLESESTEKRAAPTDDADGAAHCPPRRMRFAFVSETATATGGPAA